jgi:hypothetical protein
MKKENKKKGLPVWAWILIILGALFLIWVVYLFIVTPVDYNQNSSESTPLDSIELELFNRIGLFGNQNITINKVEFINPISLKAGECSGFGSAQKGFYGFLNISLLINQVELKNRTTSCRLSIDTLDFSSGKELETQGVKGGFKINESKTDGWINLRLYINKCQNQINIYCDSWNSTMTISLF